MVCDDHAEIFNDDSDDNTVTAMDTPESTSTEQHENRPNRLKMSATVLLLKLKEKQKLTQVALQGVIEGVTGLFQ